jgi:UDPglucose 6-dehydrogenase
MNISIVGLGKLGAPLAACLAAKGHRVIGVDQRDRSIRLINQGEAPVHEPGLDELMRRTEGRLTATRSLDDAVAQSEATFILVPTPSQTSGAYSLKYVLQVAKGIGSALQHKAGYHLVVLTSTVMPGDTGDKVLPTLEKYSGKRCGPEFGLCYNPEFVALGSVLQNLVRPDFLLIGESDPQAGDRLVELYQTVCVNQPPVVRLNFVNAELAKLAVNTFLTTRISFANLLAELCERLEGGDAEAVTAALGRDSRIGPRCLRPALGYGGPCFPRDNAALAYLARRLDVSAALPRATDAVNTWQVIRLKKLVQANLAAGGSVGLLGLAYKPGTNVLESSQGFELAQSLLDNGIPVTVFDPAPIDQTRLRGRVRYAASAADCVRRADTLVIATPCPQFQNLYAELNRNRRPKFTVIDCWRLLDPERLAVHIHYLAIGRFDRARKKSRAARKRQRDYLLS